MFWIGSVSGCPSGMGCGFADLEILRVFLVVDNIGNALHSFDTNDTLES